MSGAAPIRAGQGYVEIYGDNSKLLRDLKVAESQLKQFGQRMTQMGRTLFMIGGAASLPFAMAIRQASIAEESLNKFNAVFKESADAARAFGDALAKAIGRSPTMVKNQMAAFQSMFVGMGFAREQSLKMSETMEALALDFASFQNLEDDDAFHRFISALSGSVEVLDQYGVNLHKAALEQALLKMGIKKTWENVTEQEKVMARMAVIMESMGVQGAIGDAVKTAGSFANSWKAVKAAVEKFSEAVGKALLPMVTKIAQALTVALTAVTEWAEKNEGLVQGIAIAAASIAALGAVLITVGGAFALGSVVAGGLATAWGMLVAIGGGVSAAVAALAAVLTMSAIPFLAVAAAAGVVGFAIWKFRKEIWDALSGLAAPFRDLFNEFAEAFGGIKDALTGGDITSAVKIFWAFLQLQWVQGIAALQALWDAFARGMQLDAIDIYFDVQKWIPGADEDGLEAQKQEARRATNKSWDDKKQDNQDEIDIARGTYEAELAAARIAAAARVAKKTGPGLPNLAGIAAAIGEGKAKSEGTFSAGAVAGLGKNGNSALLEQLKASNRHLANIDKAAQNGMGFA